MGQESLDRVLASLLRSFQEAAKKGKGSHLNLKEYRVVGTVFWHHISTGVGALLDLEIWEPVHMLQPAGGREP